MSIASAYNHWASQYDTNRNRTRDLEAAALRQVLAGRRFARCLELGCGTGKNSAWLAEQADELLGVDLSENMLAQARAKVPKARFEQADLTARWEFAEGRYDLITFSLVLEHIEDLAFIYEQTAKVLAPGGLVYIGELHPAKQYAGTQARFETEAGTQLVTAFTHHVSEFTHLPQAHGLRLCDVQEFFDPEGGLPRVLVALLNKADQ